MNLSKHFMNVVLFLSFALKIKSFNDVSGMTVLSQTSRFQTAVPSGPRPCARTFQLLASKGSETPRTTEIYPQLQIFWIRPSLPLEAFTQSTSSVLAPRARWGRRRRADGRLWVTLLRTSGSLWINKMRSLKPNKRTGADGFILLKEQQPESFMLNIQQ